MTFRHLRPGDETSLISLERGDHLTAEVVVVHTDERGERYSVRAARSPREVARLLQLFRESSLEVTFEPEHRHLIAVDPHDAVIGGVFYRQVAPERTHMEKIVVGRKYRGQGVADGIIAELSRRQRARGVQVLETGWFQPEVLARFGFRVDAASGGLVLDLVAATAVPH
jgi:long-chain acyl-CoA synthetase